MYSSSWSIYYNHDYLLASFVTYFKMTLNRKKSIYLFEVKRIYYMNISSAKQLEEYEVVYIKLPFFVQKKIYIYIQRYEWNFNNNVF